MATKERDALKINGVKINGEKINEDERCTEKAIRNKTIERGEGLKMRKFGLPHSVDDR